MLCNCDSRKLIVDYEENKFIKLKCEKCGKENLVYIKEEKKRIVRGSFVAKDIKSLDEFCKANKITEKDNPEFIVIWDEDFEWE